MKLSFSTLGCPDWSFSDILTTAKDLSFDGIELSGISDELFAPRSSAFSGDNLEKINADLRSKNLFISCLTSACCL